MCAAYCQKMPSIGGINGHRREVGLLPEEKGLPGNAAVVAIDQSRLPLCVLVITASDHGPPLSVECQRKRARRRVVLHQGHIRSRPCVPAIAGTKHPRGKSSRDEP